jgi:hypothetical protein
MFTTQESEGKSGKPGPLFFSNELETNSSNELLNIEGGLKGKNANISM